MQISLNTKISIVVTLMVTMLMVGLSYWIITHFDRNFKGAIAAQQFVLISERAYDIDRAIQRIQKTIIAKARGLTRKNVLTPDRAQRELDEEPELLAFFNNGMFLFSTSGTMIAESPNLHRQGQSFAHRDYFKKTIETGRPYISDPYFSSQAHNHPAVMFTAPVFGNSGKIVAILAGSIDLLQDNFLGHNALLKIGTTGYSYLYNTDRTIIIHPDRGRILQQDEPVGVNRVFDRGIAGFEGTEENVNSRGLRALTTVKHLKTVNWILGANYPLTDAYAPSREATLRAIIAVIAGIMLSMLIVWCTTRMLTSPLLRLTSHIRGISEQGGREQEIRIDTADEIGELVATFNQMMRTISSKQEELQKLSRAVEQCASLVAITDTNGNIEYANPKFCELTGYGFDELIGQNKRFLIAGDMSTEIYREQWETIISGREWQGEFQNKKKNGERFWTVATISPIMSERGEITHFSCVQEDITERKRTEWRLATQLAVSSILAESTTIDAAIPRVLGAICTSIGWVVGGVWRVDQQENRLRLISCWHAPEVDVFAFEQASRAFAFAPGVGLPGRVWSSQQAVWIEDVLEDDNYPRKPYAAASGLRGCFAFPITLGGATVGVIEFYSREVRRPDPVFLQMMAPLGSQLGQLVERKRAEGALRESERRFRETLENIRLIAVELDLDGNIIFCNDFLLDLAGWRREEVLGCNWFGIFVPLGRELLKSYKDKIDAGELPTSYENEIVTRSGERRLVSWNNTLLYSRDGVVSGMAIIGEDITDRRVAEVKLQHLSTHDILTGLYNRTFFEEEMDRLKRGRQFPVSIIAADVDGLKGVNDSLGHEAGDRLLRMAAVVLFDAFRAEDVVARIGGDEFGVLLPEADAHVVAEAIRRIRKRLEDINATDNEFSVSISLGAATAQTTKELSKALKVSDERMYQDKFNRKGKSMSRLGLSPRCLTCTNA